MRESSSSAGTAGNHPVAVVTGGSKRIGAEISMALHAHGHRVLVHCNSSRDAAEALCAKLNGSRADSAAVVQADLRDGDCGDRVAAEAMSRFGQVDVLVNNAASFDRSPVGATSAEDWDATLHTNLRAPFLLAQAMAASLRERRGGIINLIDIYAERPLAGFAAYCAAKSGLAGLTRVLARDLAPDVRVNGISPGPIMWPDENDPERRAQVLASTPLGRVGAPDDIARAVLYLVEADFVTGQILPVCGGRSIFL